MTVLTWRLDLDKLAATADRCARVPDVLRPVVAGHSDDDHEDCRHREPDALVYEQTMQLGGANNSVYFSFENIGDMAVFGIAFPTPNPTIPVKAYAAADVSGHRGQAGRARATV